MIPGIYQVFYFRQRKPYLLGFFDQFVRPGYTTDYNNYLQKFDTAFEEAKKKGGEKPTLVARTIVKAADDNSAKMRYAVGKPAPLLLALRKLPDSWFFNLIRRTTKM